jgi:hypothetical protein
MRDYRKEIKYRMPGIERTRILGDHSRTAGGWRFDESEKMWPAANDLYRNIFCQLDQPLAEGDITVDVVRGTWEASADMHLGIDTRIRFRETGLTASLQEKFLFTNYNTVTIEYMQDPIAGVQGDWFSLNCQYYFCGYANESRTKFDRWILLDWPRTQRATNKLMIPWRTGQNSHDNAKASFRFVDFNRIHKTCIVASSQFGTNQSFMGQIRQFGT